jgi:uncharacterized protein with gpF-like domain
MPTNPKVLRSVSANAGVRAKYQKQLKALIDEMGDSVAYWLTATYRDAPPLIAMDASPVRKINRQMRELAKRWLERFDEAAPRIAEAYVKGSFAATNNAMRAALSDVGFAVKFEMTPAMREAFDASLAENISLIKSIPEQYLSDVEGIVNRSYAAGRDLATMVTELKQRHHVTSDRAVLIARDQSNKANAVVIRTRQLELGLTEAIWRHSHAGRKPRPSHVAANGKAYKISEGMLLDGKWIQPGEEINCRCTSRAVIPGI